jgi:hypothetical protein
VTFSVPFANANYSVTSMLTSSVAFGSHMDVYIYVTSKTASGFTFVLNTSNGTATNAPAGSTVDWIALPTQ